MATDMIKNRMKIIDDLRQELNKLNALYRESLEENDQYQEVLEQKQQVKEQTKDTEMRVMDTPEIKNFKEQLKDLRVDIKEHKAVLAQELADYFRETGKTEIEDAEGNIKRMVFSVRLVND
ncbi:hypothetical protein OAL67_01375 [bacterium]|nr:hypothetical protein [bacterium]